jgi:hypothetical protein
MENIDLETCLKEAQALGLTARMLFKEDKFEQSLQVRLDEITLLESVYNNTPKSDEKSGKTAGDIGESYASIAKIWYKLNNDKKDVEYLQKSRDILKATFDAGRLLASAYSTYLFVTYRLLERAVTPEEKLSYARECAWLLVRATNEDLYVDYKPAKELLSSAIRRVVELEKQIKSTKEASQP